MADHWRAPNRSYFGNQTQVADEMDFQRISCSPQFDRQTVMTQINQLEVIQTQPEVRLASTEGSLETLQIGLANSLCNVRCTVFPELTYAPFPQISISKLELVNNLHQPQATLVLSTGEANLGAHNFSNQISPASVIEAEIEATRLLG